MFVFVPIKNLEREIAPEFRPGGGSHADVRQPPSAGAEVAAKTVPKSKNWTPEHGSRGMVMGGRDSATLEPELWLLFFFFSLKCQPVSSYVKQISVLEP